MDLLEAAQGEVGPVDATDAWVESIGLVEAVERFNPDPALYELSRVQHGYGSFHFFFRSRTEMYDFGGQRASIEDGNLVVKLPAERIIGGQATVQDLIDEALAMTSHPDRWEFHADGQPTRADRGRIVLVFRPARHYVDPGEGPLISEYRIGSERPARLADAGVDSLWSTSPTPPPAASAAPEPPIYGLYSEPNGWAGSAPPPKRETPVNLHGGAFSGALGPRWLLFCVAVLATAWVAVVSLHVLAFWLDG